MTDSTQDTYTAVTLRCVMPPTDGRVRFAFDVPGGGVIRVTLPMNDFNTLQRLAQDFVVNGSHVDMSDEIWRLATATPSTADSAAPTDKSSAAAAAL